MCNHWSVPLTVLFRLVTEFYRLSFSGPQTNKDENTEKKEMAKWYMNTTTSKYIAPPIRVWSQSHRWAIQKHKSMKYQHNVNTSNSPLKCQQPPFLFLHSLLVNEQTNKRRTKYMFYNNQKHQLQTNTEFWWQVIIEWNSTRRSAINHSKELLMLYKIPFLWLKVECVTSTNMVLSKNIAVKHILIVSSKYFAP